jgi:hypothetical protein
LFNSCLRLSQKIEHNIQKKLSLEWFPLSIVIRKNYFKFNLCKYNYIALKNCEVPIFLEKRIILIFFNTPCIKRIRMLRTCFSSLRSTTTKLSKIYFGLHDKLDRNLAICFLYHRNCLTHSPPFVNRSSNIFSYI